MIRYTIVVTLILCGCLERPQNEIVDGPQGRLAAITIANQALTGYGLRPIQPELVDITWVAGDCLESSDISGCVDGAQFGLCDIWLLAKDGTWAESEFAHEIVHCSIFDGDHADPIWPELVRVIRERLADAGL